MAQKMDVSSSDSQMKRGNWYLAANRFLPALRAFFFVGAGLANMPLRAVIFWGGLSAAVWNGPGLMMRAR